MSGSVAGRERQYPCSGCGAGLEFAPGTMSLRCPHCGKTERLPETAEQVDERSYEASLRTGKPRARLGAHRVRCRGCGAATETEALAQRCPFCGAALVVEETDGEDLIAPEAVLPFTVSRGAATDSFRKWIATRWFAPSDLKRGAAQEGMRGVYVPFWTFDTFTRTFYSGQRGEHYWVTESYTQMVNGRAETRTRQVRRTRWYPASGRVERWFDDVLVPGLRNLPTEDLDRLSPWDLPALQPHRSEFLAGFDAARYEVDLGEGFTEAQKRMTPVIEDDCRRDIGGDEQRLDDTRTSWSGITYKLVLLPVWMAAYRYANRSWRVFVNARTGEVIGRRPYSWRKIVALVLFLAALVAAAVWIAQAA